MAGRTHRKAIALIVVFMGCFFIGVPQASATTTIPPASTIQVVPGGHTIGIKIRSKGVLVVGVQPLQGESAAAQPVAIQPGDRIVRLDGVDIQDAAQLLRIVQQRGKQGRLAVTLWREGATIDTHVLPAYDEQMQQYRLGLHLRDTVAGVGTLTFYDPRRGIYGALGHRIADMDTQTPVPVKEGHIVRSRVTSISRSHEGVPGEKRAVLLDEQHVLGTVTSNTDFGIYGKMDPQRDASLFPSESLVPMPVARADEVHEGPATMYTVVEGQTVQRFAVYIVHVEKQTFPTPKGMVIRVTDPALIRQTGGIVQGMSGSPIVQDGKLVGAITHVFVNNPKSGYGCFMEWMLQEAGLLPKTSAIPPLSTSGIRVDALE